MDKGSKLVWRERKGIPDWNATKLTQANDLATQGKLQSEITDRTRSKGDKIAELELENARLRQLVTKLPWND